MEESNPAPQSFKTHTERIAFQTEEGLSGRVESVFVLDEPWEFDMKRLFLLCLLSVMPAFSISADAYGKEGNWIDLFNGKNLDGWNCLLTERDVPEESVWTVNDGILTCQGEPLGYLYSKQQFKDFRLEVEYRWCPGTEPGNNGIFSRIQEPRSGPIPKCVETQLNAGEAGDVMTMQGMTMNEYQPRFFHIPHHELAGEVHGVKAETNVERTGEEWNDVVVTARGDTYTVEMNGKSINRATGIEAVSGPIGLQCEGGIIQFRRVRLEPLP